MSKRIDDIYYHVRGQSTFIDDLHEPEGLAYAVIYTSPVAHGKIKKLNISKALNCEGVIDIATYKDIPGENQLGSIIMDEPMLAEMSCMQLGSLLLLF